MKKAIEEIDPLREQETDLSLDVLKSQVRVMKNKYPNHSNDLLDLRYQLEQGIEKFPENKAMIRVLEAVNKELYEISSGTLTDNLPEGSPLLEEHSHVIHWSQIGDSNKFGNVKEAQVFDDEDGKKYAKIWLLEAENVNGNGWGVASSTLDKNIMTFIGKPYVITSDEFLGKPSVYADEFVHPSIPTDNIQSVLDHQEQFRVGTIVDVLKEGKDYYAMIEIMPKYRGKSLPPFCSPAVYQLNPREDPKNFSEWVGLHLAGLMEKPAYGARLAILKGTCIGTQNECKVQLRNAQLEIKTLCKNGLLEKKKTETKLKLLE